MFPLNSQCGETLDAQTSIRLQIGDLIVQVAVLREELAAERAEKEALKAALLSAQETKSDA